MNLIASVALKLLQSYLINVASKEFIDWVIFSVADAAVKSTKTPYDDHLLEVVDAAVHGRPLPERK